MSYLWLGHGAKVHLVHPRRSRPVQVELVVHQPGDDRDLVEQRLGVDRRLHVERHHRQRGRAGRVVVEDGDALGVVDDRLDLAPRAGRLGGRRRLDVDPAGPLELGGDEKVLEAGLVGAEDPGDGTEWKI